MPGPSKKLSDTVSGDLAMLIGQLLATTEAASLGMKSLSDESRANSSAIVAAATTLSIVERTLSEMVKVVKDGNGQEALIAQVKGLRGSLTMLEKALGSLQNEYDGLKAAVTAEKQDKAHYLGGKAVAIGIFVVVAWGITTAVAVYSAIGQWHHP